MIKTSVKTLRLLFIISLSIFITSCGVTSAIYDKHKAYDRIRTDGYYIDSYGTKYYFYDNQGGYLRIINYKKPENFFPIASYSISARAYGKEERKMLIMQYGIKGSSNAIWINLDENLKLPFKFEATGEQNIINEEEAFNDYEKIFIMRNKRPKEELIEIHRKNFKLNYSR